MNQPDSHIRNFSIIAHIDHGKSTLADRILSITESVPPREMVEQYLDDMDLERERGITIKSHIVRIRYRPNDNHEYILNLIDTPGHVDFSYEVSRSLRACEGAILVVDASQGIEAQTLAHTLIAKELGINIIPVLNKIDLPNARPDQVSMEMERSLGISSDTILNCCARDGRGVREVLDAVIERIPSPSISIRKPLKALIIDSWYDNFRGMVVLLRVFDGTLNIGQRIKIFSTGRCYTVEEIGYFSPCKLKVERINSGEVGYIIAGIKDISNARVGDTITEIKNPCASPLKDFKILKPMVFSGVFPLNSGDYPKLKDALGKLRLNDPSFVYQEEESRALGYGFRCGFLGLLHMDIVRERVEREYNVETLITAPTAICKVILKNGKDMVIKNPTGFPLKHEMLHIKEPYIRASIHIPGDYVGPVINLCEEFRGERCDLRYLNENLVLLGYYLPLNEVIHEFFERLKSATKGYATMDYEFFKYRDSEMVRLDILVHSERIDALSMIIHRDKAYKKGRELIRRMKEIIPRHLFEVIIQAQVDGKIVAKERIPPFKKDVTAKLYGGDVTRKMKLREKQKAGKRRMKRIGKVDMPQEAFWSILSKPRKR